MEKKIKFSDNPNLAKTVYGIIIAALCITAIVIGIIAANRNSAEPLPQTPTADGNQPSDGTTDENPPTPPDEEPPAETPPRKPEKKSFISPVAGRVSTEHSLTVPVFSPTLEEWRVHAGIDISCPENADVFAAFDGEVTKVYNDPKLGCTVVIDHGSDVTSVYSNLEENDSLVKVGAKVTAGEKIGNVGDSALSELADEAHLHFEVNASGACANPLEYISDESKSVSLGITVQ